MKKMVQADVTVRDPSAPSKQGTGANQRKDEAHKAAAAKIRQYADLVAAVGDVFVPLAFEVSGAHTRHVDILIKRIRDAGEDNGVSVPMKAREIRDLLAVTLARHNALIVIDHASRQRADTVLYKEARKWRRFRQQQRYRLVQDEDGDG